MSVDEILRAYERDELDFEDARDQIHALDPEVMAEVLDVLRDPAREQVHPVAVMALADVDYPPAFEHLRTLLDPEGDPEQLGIPAAITLDSLAGGRFDAERLYSDWEGMAETFAAIGAWWDSGVAEVPTLDAWLAEKRAKAVALRDQRPPPQPKASAAEHAAMRPALLAMVADFRALSGPRQHRLDYDALRRVMHLYTAWAPDDEGLPRALECVGRYLDGELEQAAEELEQAAEIAQLATSSANKAAGWNSHHHAYMNPPAKAAACVAQGVLYAASPEDRNRQQGLNYALDAVEWSGGDLRAELVWQQEQVRGGASVASAEAPSPSPKHEMGLFAGCWLFVGLGGLAMSALGAVNVIFELDLAVGTHGAMTPLPTRWEAVVGLVAASVLITGLSLFGSKVANMFRAAKGKPMLRVGILAGALGLLAFVGRGLQLLVLVNTYGSMLAYYCTDVGSIEDVEDELAGDPSPEELDRCISRTAQWDRHDLLPTLIGAGANFNDESDEPEFRSCALMRDLSLEYITTAIELGASPSTCPNSEYLIQEKALMGQPGEDETTAKIVQALLDAGWSAEPMHEDRSKSALELARDNELPATIAVLEAAGF